MKIWYAVMMDKEDTDWGTGSHDLDEAMDMARRMGAEKIAVIEDGADPTCVDEIEVTYADSFRVSAVWDDGTTVDNDIVHGVSAEAIEEELEVAREWFADRNPSEYMISYYFEGDVIGADMVEA